VFGNLPLGIYGDKQHHNRKCIAVARLSEEGELRLIVASFGHHLVCKNKKCAAEAAHEKRIAPFVSHPHSIIFFPSAQPKSALTANS
jgi:hypothetical protein